jgi:hypothetical protein
MNRLNLNLLRLNLLPGLAPVSVTSPRRYTIACAPTSGEISLSIGPEYDRKMLDNWINRLTQLALVANWHYGAEGWALHIHCHTSGGGALGAASWRNRFFQRWLPLALQAIRAADRQLFLALPQLDKAPVLVQFHARQSQYNRLERWGRIGDYRQQRPLTATAEGRLAPVAEPA